MSDFESPIDAQLRDVPVPDGLRDRLREVAAWSDDEIDHSLRAIAVPAGLARCLKQLPADEVLDTELRDVPVPAGLRARLRSLSIRRPVRKWVSELSRAAALFLVIGGLQWTALMSFLPKMPTVPADAFAQQMIYLGPLELVARTEPSEPVFFVAGDESSVDLPRDELLRHNDLALAATLAELAPQRLEPLWQSPNPQRDRGPFGELVRALNTGFKPGTDLLLLRYGVLGAPSRADDQLPEVESVSSSLQRGIVPPLVAGFDRAFLFRHRVQPVTPLNAHPSLARIEVPLVTSAASFESAERLARQNRLPAAGDIRVEEYLAAMNYGWPAAEAGGVALLSAGGPSPFGDDGARLLQIGVQAGPVRSRTLPATHLTVALDVSASMKWGGRLEMARQALGQLARQLGPRDRLSLLAFNEEMLPLVDSAGRQQIAQVLEVLEQLRADGGTNLAAALQQAVLLSQHAAREADVARRVVLITDDAGRMPAETATRVHSLLASAADDGARVFVLDLSGRRQISNDLRQLAMAGRGDVRTAANAEEAQWGLSEALTGDRGTVALDATLRITFNPKNVIAYRLFGHEATSYGGLLSAAVQSELRAGEAATTLFEIWLAPNAGSDLATSDLQWNDAETGQEHRLRRAITRGEFANSFAESGPSLQAAALAAETAEVLRESYFVPSKSRQLRGVLQLVPQVQSELRGQPEFQRFVRVIRQIDQIRGGR